MLLVSRGKGAAVLAKPIMTQRQAELFRVFKVAIQAERGAQSRYLKALDLCDDPELAKVFAAFHSEEVKHEAALMDMYDDYRARFAPDPD